MCGIINKIFGVLPTVHIKLHLCIIRCFCFACFLDSTLTVANLCALMKNVDWPYFSLHMDVPVEKYAKENDDPERIKKFWEVYLEEHPSPSWKEVAWALYWCGYLRELEVVQKKYLKGE